VIDLLPGLVVDDSSQLTRPKRRALHRRRAGDAHDPKQFWPTPPCLIWALIEYVLPALPALVPIWEFAAGAGHLVRPLVAAGRTVIASDLFPQNADTLLRCFLTGAPPLCQPIALSNPPWGDQSTPFIARGLQLLDLGQISGLVLLLRHDHLQAAERVEALNRATWEVRCNWRPVWIPGSVGNGIWSSSWVLWLPAHHARRPPLYLKPPHHAAQATLNLGEPS
jgi:hypothetical protein